MHSPGVTNVRFTPAPAIDTQLGLLGYVSCTVDSINLDGISLRRSSNGRPYLRFPTRRRASTGREFQVAWPANEVARAEIERQILDEVERQGALR